MQVWITIQLTNEDEHAHRRHTCSGMQRVITTMRFAFLLFFSLSLSRLSLCTYRLTRTCTIDTLHTCTVQILVEIIGYSLCLTKCSNGYFSFDHAYRTSSSLWSIALSLSSRMTKYSCNLVFHKRPSDSWTARQFKRIFSLIHVALNVIDDEELHYWLERRENRQIVCSHSESNDAVVVVSRTCLIAGDGVLPLLLLLNYRTSKSYIIESKNT